MENDDRIVGRVLTRREILKLLGTAGAASGAILTGCDVRPADTEQVSGAATLASDTVAATEPATAAATAAADTGAIPECVVRPALTGGPYFVDERLNRSDIRTDPSTGEFKQGVPMRIKVIVSRLDSSACTVFPGMTVDVWHCDAQGVYSDVTDPDFNTVGQQFLRGYQITDDSGVAEFTTIYPGWYPGRAVHIHFKLRTDPDSETGSEFTSQWFFEESLTDLVHAREPYASRGYRTLKNEGDNSFRAAGEEMILQLSPEEDGYLARFAVAIDVS